MTTQGWIKLHRKIVDNEYWLSEKFTRSQAWIDLLLLANHKDGHIRIRGIMVAVKRGQIGYSEQTLAERWKWSRGKVRRFIDELKTRQQIEREPVQQNSHLSSLITIVNYDSYQCGDTTNDTTDETTNGRQTDDKRYSNKNDKKEKKEKILSNFQKFYAEYPKKKNRSDAERAFLKIHPDESLLAEMLDAVEKMKQTEDWKKEKGKYIPYPASWLNGRRWEDEVEVSTPDLFTSVAGGFKGWG